MECFAGLFGCHITVRSCRKSGRSRNWNEVANAEACVLEVWWIVWLSLMIAMASSFTEGTHVGVRNIAGLNFKENDELRLHARFTPHARKCGASTSENLVQSHRETDHEHTLSLRHHGPHLR